MLDKQIGFIGAGRMATALAQGLVQAKIAAPENVFASDPSEEARKQFAEATGATTATSNLEVICRASVLVLAVKPAQFADVLEEVKLSLDDKKLIVSIAAGVRIESMIDVLGEDARIVRVMPNTPCLVGSGACGYSIGGGADQADADTVEAMLSAVGVVCRVAEKQLDAVTGLSGSGPAYVYMMIEALADGGVRMGLSRDIASRLAAQTVFGAAKMVVETGDHPAVLKDRVASPGGTTIAGIQALEEEGVRAALMAAVEVATERSIELGEE